MPTMNLADPELELIDPTPNIHALFLQFDRVFFSTKLNSRAVVRWSKRMYSCAGTCSYEGRGGLCDIALSEPLLKLRPRKDLVETLLHEMIHAFLFVTNRDQDRDGHGPNFKAHMHRINKSAGLNITIYHDFHDEVKLYLTHWWRCDGSCQKRGPHFGIVRRNSNRAPGPSDFWWQEHRVKCGGTFIKIKAPVQKVIGGKRTRKSKSNIPNVTVPHLDNAELLKRIKNKNGDVNNGMLILKSRNNSKVNTPAITTLSKSVTTENNSNNNNNQEASNNSNARAHVRNVWANKQIPTTNLPVPKISTTPSTTKPNKHKVEVTIATPPKKIKKIDDYFKANTTLKNLYGDNYSLPKPHCSSIPDTVNNELKIIDCPVCNAKIDHKYVNRHLDECLNKEIIEELTQENKDLPERISSQVNAENIRRTQIHAHPTYVNPMDLTIYDNDKVLNNNNDNYVDGHIPPNNDLIDLTSDNSQNNQDNVSHNKHPKLNIIPSPQNPDGNWVISEKVHITLTGDVLPSEIEEIKLTLDSGPIQTVNANFEPIEEPGSSKSPEVTVKEELGINQSKPSSSEPGMSISNDEEEQTCPCCGKKFCTPVEDHLDECLAFIIDDSFTPTEGDSASSSTNNTIVIEDDMDEFDETLSHNSSGTKTPCPCCMRMVESNAMEHHLEFCLGVLWLE